MRIVENNAPVKREKCWNCNSILELNLTDYDTSEEHFETVSTFDGSFHSVLKTYFVLVAARKITLQLLLMGKKLTLNISTDN